MFPLGLSLWRRHQQLMPFLWSANGITSMLASVLGVALSIQFGIASTYALGAGLYLVCIAMLALRREESETAVPVLEQGPGLVPDDVAASTGAPTAQPGRQTAGAT
jgi:hypothetical protein